MIDIRAGLLSTTLRALRDIGFLDAAKKAQLTFTVFHILGPSIASLGEIDETAGFMDDAHYILVKNFINNTTFFEWDPATYNSYFNKIKDAHDITIPKLNEMACEQVEIASVPYVSFVANKAGEQPGRQLFVRAARLCPTLARQRVGRVRPHQADRHGGAGAPAKGRRAAGLIASAPMQRRTPVFIVTSSRPRVGKTLIARALTEYFCAQRRPVAAFDVNPDEFKLIDHLPAYTAAASLNDTRGEMALFDQLVLEDQVPKVVDLGHQPFDRFFAVMQQIDFIAEVRRRAIAPMVLFVADPDERARQGYAMLRDRFPDLPLVSVFNENVPQIMRCRAELPADAARRRTDRHPGVDARGALGGRPAEFLVRGLCAEDERQDKRALRMAAPRVHLVPRTRGAAAARRDRATVAALGVDSILIKSGRPNAVMGSLTRPPRRRGRVTAPEFPDQVSRRS